MLHRVEQCLDQHPAHQGDDVLRGGRGVPFLRETDRQARAAIGHQRLQGLDVPCGPNGQVGLLGARGEDADEAVQLGEGALTLDPQLLGLPAHLRVGGLHRQGAGLHRHQGHPVRPDVVEHEGQGGTVAQPLLLCLQPGLPMRGLGTSPQLPHQVGPGPTVETRRGESRHRQDGREGIPWPRAPAQQVVPEPGAGQHPDQQQRTQGGGCGGCRARSGPPSRA